MKTTKRNLAIGAAVAILATIALAAAAGDRLKIPVTIGQGQAVTEALNFDIGNGSANPYVRSTSAGILQLSNDGGTHIMAVPTSSGSFMLNPLTSSGDVLYSSDNSGTPARLACGTGNTVLHGGTPPTCAAVATADFTGQLLVPKGGTGLASGTSGGVLAFTASTTLASSGVLGTNQVVAGGGAGAAPATGGSTFIVGAGEGGSPTVTTVRGPAATGANVVGADLYFDASDGTGSGGSGKLLFRTAPTAGSSSTANTFAEILTVKNDGTVVVGAGDATSTPHNGLIYGPSGLGANIAGPNMIVRSGDGTGTGGSGNVVFQTAPVAASSSTANSFTDVFTVKRDGSVVLGNGDGTATVTNGIMSGAARTGSNAIGSSLIIQASNGTGTAGSGPIIFQTGAGAGSSSTAATFATGLTVTNTQDVVLGGGEGATPTNAIIRGAAAAGANISGGNLFIDASNGTGTGGSGTISIRTAPSGGSGSSADTLAATISIAKTGAVTFSKTGGNVPFSCTRRIGSTVSATVATAACSAGEIVVGGGCEIVSGSVFNIQQSFPDSTTDWECAYSGSTSIRAYAICCSQ